MVGVSRSTFVTVVGVIFTALSVLYLLTAALQNIMMAFVPEPPPLAADDVAFPPVLRWLFEHFRELVAANLVLSAVSLAASIGLLLRHEWARLVFVALMLLAIAWSVGGVVLQFLFFNHLRSGVVGASAPPEGFAVVYVVIQVVVLLFAGAFCWLFGWIGWRLVQPDIRQEFGRA